MLLRALRLKRLFQVYGYQLRLTWRLLRDRRVAFMLKLIPLVGLLYLLWPIDLIPDVPIIGHIDDVMITFFSMKLFENRVPTYILIDHHEALAQREPPEDGEYVNTPN